MTAENTEQNLSGLTPRERRLVEAREPTEFERGLSVRELAQSRVIEDDLAQGRLSRTEAGRRLRRVVGRQAVDQFVSDGSINVSLATERGAPEPLIETLGASPETIGRARAVNTAQVRIADQEPLDFLQGGGDPQDLITAGYSEEAVEDLGAVAEFADQEGRIDLVAALGAGVSHATLTRLFNAETVDQAATRLTGRQTVGEQSPLAFLQGGGDPQALIDAGFDAADVADLQSITDFANDAGQVNIQEALEAGVPAETLERLFDAETVRSAATVLEARQDLGDRSPAEFIHQGGDPETLRELGMDGSVVDALSRLRPHMRADGRIDAQAARAAGIPDDVLTRVGIDVSSIPAPTPPRFAPDTPVETTRWVRSVWEQAFREVVDHVGASPGLSLPDAVANQRRLAQRRIAGLRREIAGERGARRRVLESRLQQLRRNYEAWERSKRRTTPDKYYFEPDAFQRLSDFYLANQSGADREEADRLAQGMIDALDRQKAGWTDPIDQTDRDLRNYDVTTAPLLREFDEQANYALDRMEQLVKSARGGRVEPIGTPPVPGEQRPFYVVINPETGEIAGHTQEPEAMEAQGFEVREIETPLEPAEAETVTDEIIADLEDGLDPLELDAEYGEDAVDAALDSLDLEEPEGGDFVEDGLASEALAGEEGFEDDLAGRDDGFELEEPELEEPELDSFAEELAAEEDFENDLLSATGVPPSETAEFQEGTRVEDARRLSEAQQPDEILAQLGQQGLLRRGGVDVPGALRAGFSPVDLEAVGISRARQAAAVQSAVSQTIASAIAGQPPRVPVAEPRRMPAPGETLPVDEALTRLLKDAESDVTANLRVSAGGLPGAAAYAANRRWSLLSDIKTRVEQGDLTNEQAVTLAQSIPPEISDEDFRQAVENAALVASTAPLPAAGVPYTVLTWGKSGPWERGLNIGTDALSVVGMGLTAFGTAKSTAGALRGASRARAIGGAVAESEMLGAAQLVADPRSVLRGAKRTIWEPVEAIVRPGRLAGIQDASRTLRLPATARRLSGGTPEVLRLPAEAEGRIRLGEVSPDAIKAALSDANVEVIRTGREAAATVGDTGLVVTVKPTNALRVTGPGAFSASPDVREVIGAGLTVEGTEGGLYVATSPLTRFADSTSGGRAAPKLADAQRELRRSISRLERNPDTARVVTQLNAIDDQLQRAVDAGNAEQAASLTARLNQAQDNALFGLKARADSARQAVGGDGAPATRRALKQAEEAEQSMRRYADAQRGIQAWRSFDARLSDDTRALVRAGEISSDPLPGVVWIRDKSILDQVAGAEMLPSGGAKGVVIGQPRNRPKIFTGLAESEAVVPNGTVIPKASQVLHFRGPGGQSYAIAIVGDPLTPAQIAELKLRSPLQEIRNVLGPPIAMRVQGVDATANALEELPKMIVKLKTSGVNDLLGQAAALEDRARELRRLGHIGQAGQALNDAEDLRRTARALLKDVAAIQSAAAAGRIVRGSAGALRRRDVPKAKELQRGRLGARDAGEGRVDLETRESRLSDRSRSALAGDRDIRTGASREARRGEPERRPERQPQRQGVERLPDQGRLVETARRPERIEEQRAAEARLAPDRDIREPDKPRGPDRADTPRIPEPPRIVRTDTERRPPDEPRVPRETPTPRVAEPPRTPVPVRAATPSIRPRDSGAKTTLPGRIKAPSSGEERRVSAEEARRLGYHPVVVGINKGAWDLVVDLRTGAVSHPKDLPEIPELPGRQSLRVLEYGDAPTLSRRVPVGFEDLLIDAKGPEVRYRFVSRRVSRGRGQLKRRGKL